MDAHEPEQAVKQGDQDDDPKRICRTGDSRLHILGYEIKNIVLGKRACFSHFGKDNSYQPQKAIVIKPGMTAVKAFRMAGGTCSGSLMVIFLSISQV